jgi:hypothetical protein
MRLIRLLVLQVFTIGVLFSSFIGVPSELVSGKQAQLSVLGNPKHVFSEPTLPVCYVFLEPLKPGEMTSRIIKTMCGRFTSDFHPDFAITTSYLVASFYDNKNFDGLLINYIGSAVCSSTTSYGVGQIPTSLDNRISSGSGYSGCNNVYVYDLANYSGDFASCFANCSSFGSLNDRVTSWRVTN